MDFNNIIYCKIELEQSYSDNGRLIYNPKINVMPCTIKQINNESFVPYFIYAHAQPNGINVTDIVPMKIKITCDYGTYRYVDRTLPMSVIDTFFIAPQMTARIPYVFEGFFTNKFILAKSYQNFVLTKINRFKTVDKLLNCDAINNLKKINMLSKCNSIGI